MSSHVSRRRQCVERLHAAASSTGCQTTRRFRYKPFVWQHIPGAAVTCRCLKGSQSSNNHGNHAPVTSLPAYSGSQSNDAEARIIYEDSKNYSTFMTRVTSLFHELDGESEININVVSRAWYPDQPLTGFDLLDNNTVVLVTLGSCFFQNSFTQTFVALNLPLPLVRVDADGHCNGIGRQENIFSVSTSHRWLALAIMDVVKTFKPSQVVLVCSQTLWRLATDVLAVMSKEYIQVLLLSTEEVLDMDAEGLDVLMSGEMTWNTSGTVVTLLSDMDVDIRQLLALKIKNFVVFSDKAINTASFCPASESLNVYLLTTARLFSTDYLNHTTMTDNRSVVPENVIIAVEILTRALVTLSQSPALDNTTVQCGVENKTVSEEASCVQSILTETYFDKDGYLNSNSYDVRRVCDPDFCDEGKWIVDMGLAGLDLNTDILKTLNYTIRVGTTEASPFVMWKNGAWEGFCIDMLNELALVMKFKIGVYIYKPKVKKCGYFHSYTIVQSKDKLWGAANSDGTWNGLIGMVLNEEIDLAVGPISVTAEREKVVAFTMPYMESAGGMLMKRFEDTTAKMFRTLMPFTFNLWMALAGLIVLVSILFGIINRFSPSGRIPREETVTDRWITNIWDSAWVVYGSFMEQGAEMHPHGVPGRVVLGLWWVFTILTSASYTANLAAFLTINMNAVPINTIYELAQQSQVKPLVKNGTNLYTLFQKGETAAYRRIWEMIQQGPTVQSNADAMDLVLSGSYAFLTDREQLNLLRKGNCQMLVQSEEPFNNNGLAFFARKGWPLLDEVSLREAPLAEGKHKLSG
ncbi:hypothetical protein C0Q70_00183 [Pomacea canaliculata]|uniref:Ionotropic glutamate receptor C-terminal domain-containing protein n=1 Tax=Pomacea canaliculata TaxID=400727 RepID=A0A2T7PW25_POMCA|nr:hypothetical protein C0Q70_00183 [Pomacea canaliculata]